MGHVHRLEQEVQQKLHEMQRCRHDEADSPLVPNTRAQDVPPGSSIEEQEAVAKATEVHLEKLEVSMGEAHATLHAKGRRLKLLLATGPGHSTFQRRRHPQSGRSLDTSVTALAEAAERRMTDLEALVAQIAEQLRRRKLEVSRLEDQ